MAENVTVLVRVSEMFDNYETVKEALDNLGKSQFVGIVFDAVADDLQDYLGDEVDYFQTYEDQFEDYPDENAQIGAEDPDAMRESIHDWNENIFQVFKSTLRPFEKLQEKAHLKSIGDAIEKARQLQEYSTTLYQLRQMMNTIDNRFLYGQRWIVMDDHINQYCYNYSCMLRDESLTYALSHPEEYVILESYYK